MSKIWKLSTVLVLIIGILYPFSVNAETIDYVTATRTVNPTSIFSDEEAEVTLNINGTPPVNVVKPNDVVLILDKSGSMQNDNRFNAMISASKSFVDLIDFTKHQVGVVDFSTSANIFGLSTDPVAIKNYLGKVALGGSTNTAAAINQATSILSKHRPDAQPVIVLLTDGQADNTDAALQAAKAAKDAGIVFYTVALLGPTEDPKTSAPNLLLGQMATSEDHHHFVLGSVGLADVYKAIVQEIGLATAYNVEITENVSPQFEIVPGSYNSSIPQPTVTGNTLKWNITELKNNLQLKYKVRLKKGEKAGTYNIADNTLITYKDYTNASRTYTIENTNLEVKHHAPTITDITPTKGIVQGGETVTIKGTYFRSGVKVYFGSAEATNVVVNDDQTITVTTPPGVQGDTKVTVTNDDNQSATGNFTYYANPEVTSITPNSGPFKGGNTVTINGKYFMPGVKVMFGSNAAVVTNNTANQLTVTVPTATVEGLTDVYIENPDGTKVTASKAYSYDKELPVVTEINPSKGIIQGGETVTIKGDKFRSGAKVYFGTTEATNVVVVDRQTITVTTPPGVLGNTTVKVINDDNQSATGNFTYYVNPEVTSITPNSGPFKGGNTVTINGKYFTTGVKVKFGSNAAVVTYKNANQLTVTVPTATAEGLTDVYIENPDGTKVIASKAYSYDPEIKAPVITEINPSKGIVQGGETITIKGNYFRSGAKVYFGTTAASNVVVVDGQTITVTTPPGAQGNTTVKVTNDDNQSGTGIFAYYANPEVTSLTVKSGPFLGGNSTIINGKYFMPGIKVKFGDNEAAVTYVNSLQLNIKVPAAAKEGLTSITLENPDGSKLTLNDAYTYDPPIKTDVQLDSISPADGPLSGGTIVYLTGKNIDPNVKVYVGTKLVPLNAYYSNTSARIAMPISSTAGAVDITLENPDGTRSTLTNAFTYNAPPPAKAPVVTSLSQTEGYLAGGDSIYVTGANFVDKLSVTVGGKVATVLNYYSATSIRIKIPAGTQLGSVDVVVTNPDGQTGSLPNAYTYIEPPKPPAPTVTSITPNSGLKIGGESITINGTNLVSGLKVTFNGVDAKVLNYYSATQIRVQAPASSVLGPVDVVVTNPDGQSVTVTQGYTYNAAVPTITSLSPNYGSLAGGDAIVVTGTNFVTGLTVTVGGKNASVLNYYSSTSIRIQIPAGSTPGVVPLVITNPDGTSGTTDFTYNAPPALPAPTITSLLNSNGTAVTGTVIGGAILFINGKDMVSGVKIDVGGTLVTPLNFYSSTSIRFVVPKGLPAGALNIKLVNPDNQVSNTITIDYKPS
ncbi:IPT/TIG domain-containing protein [Gottfriedia luciferensis]|uniref:IPT/TIG domain-containing protein n=1 Tax=Gottfriedia luciferensis TaxID=178774 RepID=UPI000B452BB5|nr:IPT/TIG domain-containing protein [Gottfriedia luciferensis]